MIENVKVVKPWKLYENLFDQMVYNKANLVALKITEVVNPVKTMTDIQKTLLEAAFNAQKQAYAPYSNYKVGASLIAEDLNTYQGCNVENASYPLGQCAEASAISAMVTAGARQISQLLIASPNNEFCPPCGGCRQKIREFSGPDTVIHMATQTGEIKSVPLSELLPLAFEM